MKKTTTKYLIDCSKLSPAEYEKIYKMIDSHSFFCIPIHDVDKPRSFYAFWENPTPPDELFSLPKDCFIQKIL